MQTIGRELKLSLPELGLKDIQAKVDTGAYRSAIHCHHVAVKQVNDKEILSVRFLDPAHHAYHEKELTFDEFKQTTIYSSFGQKQKRYLVYLKVKINGKIYVADFTLANRNKLKYPVLIGRTLLKGNFLVDSSRKQ